MSDKFYTQAHEWLQIGEDGLATIGITEHAQNALGDIVFVELPEPGRSLASGEACAVVESVKAASDVYAPLAGKVTEINDAIDEDPSLVNSNPTTGGWFFKMKLSNPTAFAELLDEAAYNAFVEEE